MRGEAEEFEELQELQEFRSPSLPNAAWLPSFVPPGH